MMPNTQTENSFRSLFGVELRDYWQGVFGFDVVGFDERVVHSGDDSMKNVIEAKYGKTAVDLIQGLLHSR